MFRRATKTLNFFSKNQRNVKHFPKIACIGYLYSKEHSSAKFIISLRQYCSNSLPTEHVVDSVLDHATYEKVCTETMDGLNDYFEELLESSDTLPHSDITYSDGVLTIKLGRKHGTYVINRQTPNRQIWLSSPITGPKRYDFAGPTTAETGKWVYRHSGVSLHELLQDELQTIFKGRKVEFVNLPYGR